MKQRLYYFSATFSIWLISFFVYIPSLFNGFIFNWDDGVYVLNNQYIHLITLDSIKWMLTAFHAANWHPLTWLSHAVDYTLFGEKAWGHHLINIIFHAFNSVWVFLLSLVLIYIAEKSPYSNFRLIELFDFKRFFVAYLTSILFAIHPQHVESVAWVAERKDVLFFFFFIPALLAYSIYTQFQNKKWYFASLICFALSLLSKPMAVTLPILLMLFDFYPLQQINLKTIDYKKWIINKIPFFALALATGIFTLLAQSNVGAVASVQQVEIQVRVLNALNSIIVYFGKWLLPLHLSPFYQLQIGQFQSISHNLPNILAILVTTIVAIYCWFKSQKFWLMSWLFYLVTLLPVLGLIQVGSQGMADRYTYLTTLPFYLLLSIGLVHLYLKYSKTISVFLILGICILLTHLTYSQIKIWRDPLILWNYAVRSNPDSGLSQGLLGTVYMKMEQYEVAAKHFEFSIGLAGDNPYFYNELGKAYFYLKRLDDALKQYKIAITLYKTKNSKMVADTHFNLALVYLEKKDSSQALAALEQALKIDPNHPDALALKKDLQK
jgi:tetratricopeptide (TPR) repeat protein